MHDAQLSFQLNAQFTMHDAQLAFSSMHNSRCTMHNWLSARSPIVHRALLIVHRELCIGRIVTKIMLILKQSFVDIVVFV